MGEWKEIELGQVCKLKGGYAFKSDDFKNEGVPLVKISNIQDNKTVKSNSDVFISENYLESHSNFVLKNGDIIIAMSGATTGKIGKVNEIFSPSFLNQRVGLFQSKDESKVDLELIYQIFSQDTLIQHILGNAGSSAQPNISPSFIENIKIQLPEDKPEQTRIAEILSTADEAIAHTETLIAKYQRIKTGLLQDLLTTGIDENGNIRSKATHKFVVKNGIEVPEEWEVIKLIDCVDKSTIITYGIVQTGLLVVDGVRVLRTVDLQKDKIDSSNLLRTTEEISNSYKRTILKKFDLVCNVRASVGDFNIIDNDDLVGCNTTRGVARISPKKEINPYYLLWFLRSERNTKQMELLIKGTTFIDINIADLRKIWIPIPNNKSEQDKIAEKLIQITDTLQDYNRQLLKLQSLKTGLMQDLLSGRVRVNMDNKN
jgi:type I restriction enzyme S subunit